MRQGLTFGKFYYPTLAVQIVDIDRGFHEKRVDLPAGNQQRASPFLGTVPRKPLSREKELATLISGASSLMIVLGIQVPYGYNPVRKRILLLVFDL